MATKAKAKKAAPKNFGKLSQSITYRIGSKSRSRVQAVTGSALSYAEVMEDGRRAGGRLPPLGPLMLWVQRKFKTIGGRVAKGRDGKFIAKGTKGARAARGERDSIARVAYALAWSIKRKGITGRKYMAGAVQTWQPNFESLFAASVRATIDREVTRR